MNRNLTALILIVLAVGIYFTVTKGILDEANAVASVNSQYSTAIASAMQLLSVRDKVLNDFNNISETDRGRLAKLLPANVDNIRLVIDLNNIALQHGFSLKGITAQTDAGGPGAPAAPARPPVASGGAPAAIPASAASTIATPVLSTVTVSFSLSAPYQQFQSFLQDLESNLRIMDITQLSVASSDNGIYDWTVQLKTYYLRSQ